MEPKIPLVSMLTLVLMVLPLGCNSPQPTARPSTTSGSSTTATSSTGNSTTTGKTSSTKVSKVTDDDVEDEADGEEIGEDTEAPPAEELTYAEIAQKIFTPSCIKCHSAKGTVSGGIKLNTYDLVQANLAAVNKAIMTGKMPPTGPLNADLVKTWKAWFAQGAPE